MKKRLLSFLLAAASIDAAHAQSGYTFSVQAGQTYTPLATGATDLSSATTAWNDEVFSAPLPFTFQLDRRALTTLRISDDAGLVSFGRMSANGDTVTGFAAMDGDLRNRGGVATPPTPSKSPIRYLTTGTAPSRIFKVEFFNAGFLEDAANTDSVNFQIWLYEGSNVVEIRYGASRITPANLPTYFPLTGGGGPFVGFLKNVDFNNGTYGKLFYLRGTTSAPVTDSAMLPTLPTAALTGFPASGTVYRFAPTGSGSTSIGEAAAAARSLKLYPTVAAESITIEWSGTDGEPYQMINATGQQLRSGRLQRGTQRIAVDTLPAGTYYVELAGGTHVFLKR